MSPHSSLPGEHTPRKLVSVSQGDHPCQESNWTGLIPTSWDSQSPELLEKIFPCCLSHLGNDILLWQSKQTNTLSLPQYFWSLYFLIFSYINFSQKLYNLCSYYVLCLIFVLPHVNSISTRAVIFFFFFVTPYILWRLLDIFLLSEWKGSSDWQVWWTVNFCFNLDVIISEIMLKNKINVKCKKYTSSQAIY